MRQKLLAGSYKDLETALVKYSIKGLESQSFLFSGDYSSKQKVLFLMVCIPASGYSHTYQQPHNRCYEGHVQIHQRLSDIAYHSQQCAKYVRGLISAPEQPDKGRA